MRFIYAIILILLTSSCSESPMLKPLNSDQTIVAFGDSLTFGYGASIDQSYPSHLQELLGIEVINEGISGETSSEGLTRLESVLDKYQPQMLILCHGANDMLKKQSLTSMQANLGEMITMAQERDIQVVLIAVPEASLFLPEIEQYPMLAKEFGIPIEADIIREILKQPSLHSDVIHPNAQGYQMLAEAIYELLKSNNAI